MPASGTETRDEFALGLVPTFAATAIATAWLAGLLAPGWLGVGGEVASHRWRLAGSFWPMASGIVGTLTTLALVLATLASARATVIARLFAAFGGGLLIVLGTMALKVSLEPQHVVWLAVGALVLAGTAGAEATPPRSSRALGMTIAMAGLSAALHIGAWGIQALALKRVSIDLVNVSRSFAALALIVELSTAALVIAYVVQRPGARASVAVALSIASAFGLAAWTLGPASAASASGGHGNVLEALQRALSLRLESAGPIPPWVSPTAIASELGALDVHDRIALLPLALAQWLSVTLPIGCLLAARRETFATLAAMALAIAARGQIDVPLSAIELGVAALAALTIARAPSAEA